MEVQNAWRTLGKQESWIRKKIVCHLTLTKRESRQTCFQKAYKTFPKEFGFVYLKLEAKFLLSSTVIQSIVEDLQAVHDMSVSSAS